MKLTEQQFNDVISAATTVRKGPRTAKTTEAARLYLTGQVDSIRGAAEQAGCHYNNAWTLIRKIEGLAEAQAKAKGMVLVTVEIPEGKVWELERLIKRLKRLGHG